DVYKEVDTTIIATISETTGGGFENIDKTAITSTKVVDTIDTVKVILEATTSTSEDGGSITYTAKLVDADGKPVVAKEAVVVTLENGETITIEANSSEGTSSPVAVNRDDVYKETDSITNSIKGVTGGESFEKLQADTSEVSTEIKDDEDPVKVKLEGSSEVVEGQNATYTVS
ncbi:hypothetical protein CKA56_16150, partial [Arcobacter venerupis]|uniref:immunoglobulin-like domain-containing protein n=1 Tax=Arcobacter venerupis TaxID=1054033 RepID=UPI001005F43E